MEPRPSNLEIRPPPSNKSVSTGDKRKQDYLTDDEQKDLQFKYNLKRVKPEGFWQDKDEDTFNKLWREPKALPVSHGLPDLNEVGRKALCAHWFIEGTYHRDKERGGDKTGPQD
ncbi:Protein of unknown function [Pyronema omphalodes CBS 100304]|uniref:Uncharacterized protein n=1 Tax=Pyronema omphalodes (strain CBS 100304) TaxID=1076935 RepID=U4LKY1_PYROM|nr:Protein of unknown function [Pyronema omphalodes CBS 100304]